MTAEPVVLKTTEITAPAHDVWRALTETDRIAQWMGGARVESEWLVGSDVALIGQLHTKPYRDHGTVLAVERDRLLKYSHWTAFSRLPDLPENRTLITFRLDPNRGTTRLTVRHEHFYSDTAYRHSNFFWGFALTNIKKLVEDEQTACSSGPDDQRR